MCVCRWDSQDLCVESGFFVCVEGLFVEGISQPWHCLAPRLSAKSQGSWISWKEVYRAVVSGSMSSVEVVSCNTFIKGKADQTRHPLAQGDYDRVRRHQPVQGMGSHKEGCRGVKGCGIHRRKASRPDSSNLHRGTQDRIRFDHRVARTTCRNPRVTTTTPNASAVRTSGYGRAGRRARTTRPPNFIARSDYGERISTNNRR